MNQIRLLLAATALLCASEAGAVDVTVSVSGEVFDGAFSGQTGSGSVTFDDALLTGTGEESITPEDGLTLEFTIFGQTFLESDDIDYTAEPSLDFVDGEIVALDFIVSEVSGNTLTDINLAGVFGFDMFDVVQTIDGTDISIFGEVFVDEIGVVPLPGALALFAAGLGFLGVRGHRPGRIRN